MQPYEAETSSSLEQLRKRRAFEMSGDGWIVVDGESGLILETSPFLGEVLGHPRQDATGKDFLGLLLPQDKEAAAAIWDETQRKGNSRRDGLMARTLSGQERMVDLRGQRFDESGRSVIQFYLRDATARMQQDAARTDAEDSAARARDEAISASAAKDRFLASLSHELRTPLNPALLLASENARCERLSPDARRDFEAIRKHIELEVHLIDDILDLTRISQGKLAVNLHPVGLHAIIRESVTIIRSEVHEKHLNLAVQLHAEKDLVSGDAVRLQQVFWNLLRNAVKFTPPHGTISVETRLAHEGRAIEALVTDTGIGLTVKEIADVFGAFAQGRHTGRSMGPQFGGLGLGLAISRSLVELHSGSIRAMSDGPNTGATFVVALPLEVESAPPFVVAGNAGTARNSERILLDGQSRRRALLVEDHEGSRKALAWLLGRRGYDVVAAETGTEARQHAATAKFDLLISDIGLPDVTGYELMEEFRERYDLRGIAVTGYGMEADVARTAKAGFFCQLTKPVSITALETALAAFHASTDQS